MFAKNVVKLDPALLYRAKAAAEKAGYSSMEEFIRHAVEKELGRIEEAQGKEEVMN